MRFTTRLYIEGYEIDLTDRFDGSVNYSLDNIEDISTISSNYSTTITLPGTNRNCLAFNWLFNPKTVGSGVSGSINIGTNFDFKRKAKATLVQDGQVILDNCYARLISATVNNNLTSFDIQITGVLGSLISNLGDIRIQDLQPIGETTIYDHALTLNNIVNSWNISSSDLAVAALQPFVYPLHDSGQFETVQGSSWYTQNLRPAVYLKDLFDQCFATASYTYESNFIQSSSYFQSLIMPYSSGDMSFPQENYVEINQTVFNTVVTQSAVSKSIAEIESGGSTLFTGSSETPYFLSGSFFPTVSSIYAFTVGFDYQVFYSTTTNFVPKVSQPIYGYIQVAVYKNSGGALARPIVYSTFKDAEQISFNGLSASGSLQTIQLTTNAFVNADEHAIISITFGANTKPYFFTSNPHSGDVSGIANVHLFINGDCTLSVDSSNVIDGNIVTWQMFCPKDLKCADLVQSVLRLWNLYPVASKDRLNHLVIKTHDEFYNPLTTKTLEWSSKLSKAEDFIVTPVPQINTGYLLFSYKQDKDWWNTYYTNRNSGIYGQIRLNLGYEFSQDTKNVMDGIIWSPTVPVTYTNNFIPCEQYCEVTQSRVSIAGYSASLPSATTSSLSSNPLTHARIGGQISYFGQTYNITNVINPQSFTVDRTLVPSSSLATFKYVTNSNPVILPYYQSKDNNLTRSTVSTNPKLVFYNGLRPVNAPIYIQYTPLLTSISYSYYSGDQTSSYWVSSSIVPYCSHINDTTNQDLLFLEPYEIFFNIGNYPTSSLFNNWQNSAEEISDPESKQVDCKLHLNSLDISNLDFSNRIFINGTTYRLSEIQNYTSNPGETTAVTLVRLPYQIYNNLTGSAAPIVTGSAFSLIVTASISESLGSKMTGININTVPVHYSSGNVFPLSGSNQGFFTSSITEGTNTVRVFISSSIANNDYLNITDAVGFGSTLITYSGSGYIESAQSFLSVSGLIVNISGSLPLYGNVTIHNAISSTNITSVTGITGFSFTTISGVGFSSGSFTSFTGGINITTTGTIPGTPPFSIVLKVNGVIVDCKPASSGASYSFASRTYDTTSQNIYIDLSTGTC